MTLNEFKAWLEGYSHSIVDAPTSEQWSTIKDKIAKVSVFGSIDIGEGLPPIRYGEIKTVPLPHITTGTPLPHPSTVVS